MLSFFFEEWRQLLLRWKNNLQKSMMHMQSCCFANLRWPVPIYMRVGYVFDSRFWEWKIQPISTNFCILNK